VLDATWLRDFQNIEHTKFQNRKVVVRDQGGLLVGTINHALRKKSSLWMQSIHHAYGGLSLLTNNIASLPELEQVADAVRSGLGWDSLVSASLPQSRSYLKIMDIPILKPGLMDKIDSAFVCKVMLESPVGHLISLASSSHVMHNTHVIVTPAQF
jgi:hypothetical protein